MSNQIVDSTTLLVLSEQEQELLVGGSDFELSGSNFANRLAALRGTTFSGPNGSFANSAATKNASVTAAQDFLGLGGALPTGIGALGPAMLAF
jgi:hypothetical protein